MTREERVELYENFIFGGGMAEKLLWRGTVTSVQPRIRLLRSFDQRSHSYHEAVSFNMLIASNNSSFFMAYPLLILHFVSS